MDEKNNSKEATANQTGGGEAFHEKIRGKLSECLAMALPVALIDALVVWIMQRFFNQPWQVVWFVVPLVLVAYGVWKFASAKKSLKLGWPLVILFALYTLIFCLAAGTGFLDF